MNAYDADVSSAESDAEYQGELFHPHSYYLNTTMAYLDRQENYLTDNNFQNMKQEGSNPSNHHNLQSRRKTINELKREQRGEVPSPARPIGFFDCPHENDIANPILTEFSETKSMSMTQKSTCSFQICYVTFKDNVIPSPMEFSDPMQPKDFSTEIAASDDVVQLRLSKVEDQLLAVRDRIKGMLAKLNTTRPTLNISSSTPQASVIAPTHHDQRSVMRDSVRTSSPTIIPAGLFDSNKDEFTRPSKHDPSADKLQTATTVPKRAPRKSCTPRQRQVSSVEFYFRPKIIPPQYIAVTPPGSDNSADDF